MVMAVNNAPLLGSNLDISQLDQSFYDGQKLRQKYDKRQQDKVFGQLMQIDDHNKRLEVARRTKYAGALVPRLHQFDELRKKAALDNLQQRATTSKTFAEADNLGAKTKGQLIDNAGNITKVVANVSNTGDPMAYGALIGGLVKNGVLTDAEGKLRIDMLGDDQESAKLALNNWASANPELAKMYLPEFKTVDAGDAVYGYSVDPRTGLASDPSMQINKGQSPDNIADNATKRYVSDNSLAGSMYTSDNNLAAKHYDVDNRTAVEAAQLEYQMQQDEIKNGEGELRALGGKFYVVYKDGTATPAVDENGQPILDTPKNVSKQTGEQKKAAMFATRMQEANDIINGLETQGVTRGSILSNALGEGIGNIHPILGNSPEQKQYLQAKRSFINSVLRDESGAAIGKDEFESADKQYFPQLGDPDEVIAQKAIHRQQVIDGLLSSSGGISNTNAPQASTDAGTKLIDSIFK